MLSLVTPMRFGPVLDRYGRQILQKRHVRYDRVGSQHSQLIANFRCFAGQSKMVNSQVRFHRKHPLIYNGMISICGQAMRYV